MIDKKTINNIFIKTFAVVFLMSLILVGLPEISFAESAEYNAVSVVASGKCSDNKTNWTLDSEGRLQFDGIGTMTTSSFQTESFVAYKDQTKEVDFGSGITSVSLGGSPFLGYTLDKMIIPDNIESISVGFMGTSVDELTISTNTEMPFDKFSNGPRKVTFTGTGFADMHQVTSSLGDGYNLVTNTVLEEAIIEEGVVGIKKRGFATCKKLTTISVPSSCKSIGEEAFSECSLLNTVNLSDEIEEIGYAAFKDCIGLNYVKMPANTTVISTSLFSGCDNLLDVDLSNKTEEIYGSAFSSCDSLSSITIPDSVTTIGPYAFSFCKELTDISLSKNLSNLPDSIFSGCTKLDDVVIPANVRNIGKNAFQKCYKLSNITLPDAIASIGDSAFSECNRLRSIDIKSATEIGNSAFYSCKSLQTVNMKGDEVAVGGCAFLGCSQLESVTGNAEIVSLGDYAFEYCSSLQALDLGNSLKEIGEEAFVGCKKDFSVEIPETVEAIGKKAFSDKMNIYIKCPPPAKVTTAFSTVTGKIYYYCDSEWDDTERQLWNRNSAVWEPMHKNTTHRVAPPGQFDQNGWEYDICDYCGTLINIRTIYQNQEPESNEIVDLPAVKISKPKASKGKFTAKWKKVSKKNLKKIQGIEIQVAADPNFTSVVKSATAGKKKTSKKVSGLQKKTKYWVRVRAYRNGPDGKHVSAWKTKSVKTK